MTSQTKQYSLTLSKLLKGFLSENCLDEKFNSINIEGLSLDSRDINNNYLMVYEEDVLTFRATYDKPSIVYNIKEN